MLFIMAALMIAFVLYLSFKNKDTTQKSQSPEGNPTETQETEATLPIEGAYQKKWMFTYNEKDAYNKLLQIAKEKGYTVFSKVRLLDLVEPSKGTAKYKTYLYKIQSKHVDFVLCDEKLVARVIIELDDGSHDTEERKKRDSFVDQVLTSVGYKVIHTRAITEDLKNLF